MDILQRVRKTLPWPLTCRCLCCIYCNEESCSLVIQVSTVSIPSRHQYRIGTSPVRSILYFMFRSCLCSRMGYLPLFFLSLSLSLALLLALPLCCFVPGLIGNPPVRDCRVAPVSITVSRSPSGLFLPCFW